MAAELGDRRFKIRPSPAPRTREEVHAVLGAIRRATFKRCSAKGQGHASDDVLGKVLETVLLPKLRNPAFRDDARLVAYASGAARRMVAKLVDERAKRGDEISLDAPELAKLEDPRASSEDDLIARVDAARLREAAVAPGPGHAWQVELLAEVSPSSFGVPLTADFDRSEFWDQLRVYAARYVPEGAPSRAARSRVLEMTSCPPVAELPLTSTTPLHAVLATFRRQETSAAFRKRERPSPVASPSAALMQAGAQDAN